MSILHDTGHLYGCHGTTRVPPGSGWLPVTCGYHWRNADPGCAGCMNIDKKEESMDDKAIRLIAEQCGYKIEEVTPEKILEGDLLMDSLDMLELVMVLEDEFVIEIDDAEVEAVKTVGDVIALVKRISSK